MKHGFRVYYIPDILNNTTVNGKKGDHNLVIRCTIDGLPVCEQIVIINLVI